MLVILHCWSDSARSFNRLGKTLVDEGIADSVKHVRLGDYVSIDDHVGFDDLSEALQAAWRAEELPTRTRSVDVVVHSTGALVIRHWMTKFHAADAKPITDIDRKAQAPRSRPRQPCAARRACAGSVCGGLD